MQIQFIFIFTMALFFLGCKKYPDCGGSIKGKITIEGTNIPVSGAKVFGQAYRNYGSEIDWEIKSFDTLITDETGGYEFVCDEYVEDWNIQIFSKGHDMIATVLGNGACNDLEEDFELRPYAMIKIKTIDIPELKHNEVYVFTYPFIDYYQSEFGSDQVTLGINETAEIWFKSDPDGEIGYRFIAEGVWGDIISMEYQAEPGEMIELEIEM